MDLALEYLKEHKNFFVLIAAIVVLYYVVMILVFRAPKKNKKNIDNKNFTQKVSNTKNFNIFDKTNNASNIATIKSNKISVKKTEESSQEDWLEAYNNLNEQALNVENQLDFEEFLNKNGIKLDDSDEDLD